MKKVMIAGAVLLVAVGCNKDSTKSSAAATADGAPAAAVGSTGTGTAAGSILDKALSFLSGGPFEGDITMTMSHEGKPPETIVYEVKGDKMRFDRPTKVAGDTGFVIIDGKKFISVDDNKKMAIVMSSDSMPGMGPHGAAAAAKKPTIDKTGKTDTVAGYSCEIWKIAQDDGGKSEVCIAKGIAFPSIGKPEEAWMSELVDQKMFPLRAVTSDATGKEKSRMEVSKIEKKSIDDSKFQIPAGYKETSMEEMLKAMGAMGAMGRGHHPPPTTP